MNIRHPKIVQGERFDWKGTHDTIEREKLWENRPELAAAMSDPGICSCPRCHADYWSEGHVLECDDCGAQFPVDWWSMLSWGVQHGRILANPGHPMHKHHLGPYYKAIQYQNSEVFKWGTAHPDCSLDMRVVFKGTDWIAVWAGTTDYTKEGTMVGGKVVGLARGAEDTLLHVEDNNDRCSVRCLEQIADTTVRGDGFKARAGEKVEVAVGDSVWWQAGNLYWTPTRYRRTVEADKWSDVPLVRVGYSH